MDYDHDDDDRQMDWDCREWHGIDWECKTWQISGCARAYGQQKEDFSNLLLQDLVLNQVHLIALFHFLFLLKSKEVSFSITNHHLATYS